MVHLINHPNTPLGPRRSRYDSDSNSRSPPRNRRRKSFSEQAMSAMGMGGSDSNYGRRDRGRDRSSHRRSRYDRPSSRSPSDSRSRSHYRGGGEKDDAKKRLLQAARAALTAGAAEAFKQRKAPGGWAGAKGRRILTAAVTAGGTDGLVDRDPNKHGTRHVVESTLAGLAASHFAGGGSRSQSRDSKSRDSRSRDSRSRGRSSTTTSTLKKLAATGLITAAGKQIFDHISRSRSRPRGRADFRSDDDDEDDDGKKRGSKKRSKSVQDYITQGMAVLGLGEEDDHDRDDRSRDDRDDRRESRGHRGDRERDDRGNGEKDDRERRHRRDRYDDFTDSDEDSEDYKRDSRRGKSSKDVSRTRPLNGKKIPPSNSCDANENDQYHSQGDSDLGDSSDERKKRKKMKRDVLVTSGMASVATIHAAHAIYGSVGKRKHRMHQLREGEITEEEARKRRIKANTMDAVTIGLAAIGIKGAYDEWKEVIEKRKENNHFEEECHQRAMKRERRREQNSNSPKRNRVPDEIESATSADGQKEHSPSYRDENPHVPRETPQIAS